MTTIITVENVSLKIGKKVILNDINLVAKKGQFTALIGANGSGKSSLIKSIARHNNLYSGNITLNNKNIKTYKHKEFAKIVAVMSQHNTTLDELTVEEVISYGRAPHRNIFASDTKEDLEIIRDAMVKTDLINLSHRTVATLSGGELQRVYLAACIAQNPDVLLLDEPTNHLDVAHQYKLLTLVKNLVNNHNLTVICVLHDINQAVKYADHLVILKEGNVYASGKPEEIVDEKMIDTVFDINSKIYKNKEEIHVDFLPAY